MGKKPEVVLNNKIDTYHYTINIGALSLKRPAQFNHDLKHLDAILSCIKQPEVVEKGLLSNVKWMQNATCVKFNRIWNLLFGTHEWYNENRARQLLKHYSALACNARPKEEKAQVGEVVKEKREKQLLAIYDQLDLQSKADGVSYLKGIKRDQLLDQADFSLNDLFAALPEMKELKKAGAKLLSAVGKTAAESALEALGRSMAGPLGGKVVPLIGMKAGMLTQMLLAAIAKELGLKLKQKPFIEKNEPRNHAQETCLAIVPYQG